MKFRKELIMLRSEQVVTEQLHQAVYHLVENIQETTTRLLTQPLDSIHMTINNFLESWLIFTRSALHDEDQISDAQIAYWQDYLSLCETLHQDLALLKSSSDDSNAKETTLTVFMEKFYFLISGHVKQLLTNVFDGDDKEALESYHQSFAAAIADGNFKNDSQLRANPHFQQISN
jgi:hypothetical protein